MKRGDLVTVSPAGDYGKPRPAVVVQSDWLTTNESVLVSLFTSTLVDAPIYRLLIEASEMNGLKLPSQIMVDKIIPVMRNKCGPVIGRLERESMIVLNHMLSVVIGIVD